MDTVVGGPASEGLAKRIAKILGCRYVGSQVRVFPDGESKLTLLGIPKGSTLVVQSTPPPVDTNLLHALSLISAAKKTSSRVIAAVPYLCYMRQDMEFLPGELVTSRMVARMLGAAGASRIITIDIHSRLALNYFEVPVVNASASGLLASYFGKMKLNDPVVVAPDLFWSNKAKEFAEIIGADHAALNKQRDRRTGNLKILQKGIPDLSGRDVILLDDMVSSGASMVLAAKYAKKCGCNKILAACTHPVLVGDAEQLMRRAGISKIISSNTIPHRTNRVDISGVIAQCAA